MSDHLEKWGAAQPLEKYSSLHQVSLFNWLKIPYYFQIVFNKIAPLKIDPKANLVFRMIDDDKPVESKACFSIQHLTRWRTDISPYQTFDQWLNSLIRWHRCNYLKSLKNFENHGCRTVHYTGDWSDQAQDAYELYFNVVKGHGDRLYDRTFFQAIAKHSDYHLLTAWHEDKMIGCFVLLDEPPYYHCICCGMDYNHSSKSYMYSWLSYELCRLAINSKKYTHVDVGMTADEAKHQIGFTPIPSRMDLYAKGFLTHHFLRLASKFVSATIDSQAQMHFSLKK